MKNFLVLLCGLTITFFSTQAQDSTVCIKPSTARYFLEIEDEVFLLREKDSVSNELIYNQALMLEIKDKIIASYQVDSITYQKRDEAYNNHLTLVREQLTEANKEVGRQKLLKWLAIGLGVAGMLLM